MWTVPQLDSEPPEEMALVEVHDALVTAFDRGPLRTEVGPARWVTGAVHDAGGRLVLASQRRWHGSRLAPAAADPGVVAHPEKARRLGGTRLYAGHWSSHFGHFLLETLPTLWPDPATCAVDGLVAHRQVRGQLPAPRRLLEMTSWQQRLVELTGHPTELHVVQRRPARVDHLLVPERPVLLKRWVHPRATELWGRVATAVGRDNPGARVYLSRTRFHAAAGDRARTDESWDALLDRSFAAAGFDVVHPETLPVDDQVALVRGADVVAGLSGSALHLTAFADSTTRVLSIGDQRTPRRPVPAQVAVDAAGGRRSTHVAYGDQPGLTRILADLG